MKAPEARKFDIFNFMIKMQKFFAGGAAPLQPPRGAGPPLNASSKLSAQRFVLKVQALGLNPTYIPVNKISNFHELPQMYHKIVIFYNL